MYAAPTKCLTNTEMNKLDKISGQFKCKSHPENGGNTDEVELRN